MSLVGTRPPTVDEWDKYELHHRARLATKDTCLAECFLWNFYAVCCVPLTTNLYKKEAMIEILNKCIVLLEE